MKPLRLLLVVLISISHLGCATKTLISAVESQKYHETNKWNISSVKFSAIEQNRFMRMCVDLENQDGKKQLEISADLDSMVGDSKPATESGELLPSGMYVSSEKCVPELKSGESEVTVSEFNSNMDKLEDAIKQVGQATQADAEVVFLHQGGTQHVLILLPGDLKTDMSQTLFSGYDEEVEHTNNKLYLALPVTLYIDAVVIYVGVVSAVLCVFLPPGCLVAKVAMGITSADMKSTRGPAGRLVDEDFMPDD